MGKQIVVIGSSNIDLIMKLDWLPRRGETITGGVFMQTFGGKGANQAVAAARSGGDVAFVNCVGDDPYGAQIIANMKSAGIKTEYVFVEPGVASGTALIMIGNEGDNCIAVAPGANFRLEKAHIDRAQELIQNAEMVVFQYEIRPDTLEYAIETAAAAGRKIMFNMAPVRAISEACLSKVDTLVVNESEAEFLVGFAVEGEDKVRQAAGLLLDKGIRRVIITLGSQGACVAEPGQSYQFVPAFNVKAVDTTAAGDVFCGALAAALVEGKPLKDGVRFANAAAAISVTRLGAQPSVPTRDEVDRFLSENK